MLNTCCVSTHLLFCLSSKFWLPILSRIDNVEGIFFCSLERGRWQMVAKRHNNATWNPCFAYTWTSKPLFTCCDPWGTSKCMFEVRTLGLADWGGGGKCSRMHVLNIGNYFASVLAIQCIVPWKVSGLQWRRIASSNIWVALQCSRTRVILFPQTNRNIVSK